MAGTSLELLAHFVGCARAGVVFAPLDPALDASTVRSIGETLRPDLVLAAPGFEPRAALFAAPNLWCTALDSATVELPAVQPDDPHVAFFTSGSTGIPKAALLSHRTSVLRSHPGSQLEPRGTALCPYPLHHMAGWTIAMQQWHARAPVAFVGDTAASTLLAALTLHDIERFNAIPALWIRLSEFLGDAAAGALPSLRFADTGTSPTSPELLATIAAMAPNAHVRVFYGSTEAGNVASMHDEDLVRKPDRCGRPSVLTEVRLSPDGELLVHGPLMFDGYLNDPEATAEAFTDDGWYRTGDRAELDDDGFLTIVGRLGTTIRTGGENVDPHTVEAALASHPGIDEVAVFGMPDPGWGEVVWVAVSPVSAIELDDIQVHLGPDGPEPRPKHQIPRHLLKLDTIPRTSATGQIDRLQLRRLATEEADGA